MPMICAGSIFSMSQPDAAVSDLFEEYEQDLSSLNCHSRLNRANMRVRKRATTLIFVSRIGQPGDVYGRLGRVQSGK